MVSAILTPCRSSCFGITSVSVSTPSISDYPPGRRRRRCLSAQPHLPTTLIRHLGPRPQAPRQLYAFALATLCARTPPRSTAVTRRPTPTGHERPSESVSLVSARLCPRTGSSSSTNAIQWSSSSEGARFATTAPQGRLFAHRD